MFTMVYFYSCIYYNYIDVSYSNLYTYDIVKLTSKLVITNYNAMFYIIPKNKI